MGYAARRRLTRTNTVGQSGAVQARCKAPHFSAACALPLFSVRPRRRNLTAPRSRRCARSS
eukprot:1446419-Prymnesium_polylepis.1